MKIRNSLNPSQLEGSTPTDVPKSTTVSIGAESPKIKYYPAKTTIGCFIDSKPPSEYEWHQKSSIFANPNRKLKQVKRKYTGEKIN